MAKGGDTAERVRAFVAARVRKDGKHYARGNAARLAEHLRVSQSWVTEFTDPDPRRQPKRYASFEQTLAICEFYGITLTDVAKAGRLAARAPAPSASRPPPREDPLALALAEVVAKWPRERSELEAFVNSLRLTAGLPALESGHVRRRAKSG